MSSFPHQGHRCDGFWIGLALATILPIGIVSATAAQPPASAEAQSLPVRVEAFLSQNQLQITASPPVDAFPPAQTDITLAISGPQGKVLDQRATLGPKTGQCQVRLDGKQLPTGPITLQVTAVNRQTQKRLLARRTLDRPLEPGWLGTKVGLSDVVPAPWTPVEVKGRTVSVWGRTYQFAQSALPTEVVIQGTSVLAGPIALRGRSGGQPLAWHPGAVTSSANTAASVSFETIATAEGLALQAQTCVEYDGMVRVDLELKPTRAKTSLDELVLEIPLKQVHARYLYHFPGHWGSVANSGNLPEQGWTHAFKPFVWLGDEDRGFSWFCESDENWAPRDPKQAITIGRQGGTVVLRCHLVERARELTAPMKYTFGFQATPVKRPEKTVWDYRITHDGNYGLESQPAVVTGGETCIAYTGAGHLKAKTGTFECWYRSATDTERGVAPESRKDKVNHEIFTVRWGSDMSQGSNCGLYWNHVEQGLVAWSRKAGKVNLYLPARLDWKAGQWHHLALTWSQKVRIYIDGTLRAEAENPGFIPEPVSKATIELGGSQAKATIDEVRILDIAQRPTVGNAPFAFDAHTLLLDHFDDYGHKDAKALGKAGPALQFVPARFGQGPTWESTLLPTRLDWLASQGVRTICFHEHWSPYQSYPDVTDENRPRLKSLVDACHKRGISLLLYMARQLADNCPEWELYGAEALVEPKTGLYVRQPQQKDYYVCWRSPWKDFCLVHLDRLLAEFGHDGWYLDGPEWPQACKNREHGCGYVATDGTIHPTYDIFATRDFMKRLYVLTRQRKPEGQLNIHNSTVMVIPTLGWGTSSWGGEQLDAIQGPVKTLDALPLDAFRTEFMGRQWGVPSEFLVYDGKPYYAKDLLAVTLLHGVLVRPFSSEQVARVSQLWKAYDTFPFNDATIHPYWANKDLLDCAPAGIYATAYERPEQGLLLFVSNLGERPVQGSLKIRPARLGWERIGKAWDAISGESLALEGDSLIVPLDKWQYRVLRVEKWPAARTKTSTSGRPSCR